MISRPFFFPPCQYVLPCPGWISSLLLWLPRVGFLGDQFVDESVQACSFLPNLWITLKDVKLQQNLFDGVTPSEAGAGEEKSWILTRKVCNLDRQCIFDSSFCLRSWGKKGKGHLYFPIGHQFYTFSCAQTSLNREQASRFL